MGVSALSAADPLSSVTHAAERAPAVVPGGGKAKAVIYVMNAGAMSQLDSFDPKPDSDVQGNADVIGTAIPGVQVSGYFPESAKRLDRVAVVRSLTTTTGAHDQARYLMRTSYREIASIRHPSMGVWAERFLGKGRAKDLPASVTVSAANRHPGAGFLPTSFSPLPVGDPDRGVENTSPPEYVTDDSLRRRLTLIDKFDQGFREQFPHPSVSAYSTFYDEAVKLMSGGDLAAFDLEKEPAAIRDAYGRNKLGQGLLLARRLVQAGVRFIEVENNGWDMHSDVDGRMREKGPELDQGFAALLDDLQSQGMLDDTLVVLTTEFGRKPGINDRAGRDHHPGAFSSLLAGGGIRGGEVFGETDKEARSVEDGHVTPQDFNATIAAALGLPLSEEIISPSGRPFTVTDAGEPLSHLFG
ncbi:MAG: DUF1501 domain-containing protein [Planctomycetota bacterium]